MQLFAFDGSKILFVSDADKEKIYSCLECKGPVKARGGASQQLHFFHLYKNPCRQRLKSNSHLQLQFYLQNLLGKEGEMEKPFHSIKRVADIVWEKKKIIYEIQCSPIAKEEIEKRQNDYLSLGYHVVWILYDGLYNNHNASSSEKFLRHHLSFFAKIKPSIQIYDELELFAYRKRLFFSPPLPVDLTKPFPMKELSLLQEKELPKGIQNRLHLHPFYFSGDVIDRLLKQQAFFSWKKMKAWEKVLEKGEKSCKKKFFLLLKFFCKNYRLFLEKLLL